MNPLGATNSGQLGGAKGTYEVMAAAHSPWILESRLLRVEFTVASTTKPASGLKALFGSRTPAWDCMLRYAAQDGAVVRASRHPYQADSDQEALFFFVRAAREGRLVLADPVFGDPEADHDSALSEAGAKIAARGLRAYRDSIRGQRS